MAERYVVSQVVIPADIVDDRPVLDMVWEQLHEKAATGIAAERPGWRIEPDQGSLRTTHFSRFAGDGDGDNVCVVPCGREDAAMVTLVLAVWAEPLACP